MTASTEGFPKSFSPRAVSRDRPFSPPPVPIVPRRSLQQDPRACSSWLLPPEPATGLEAMVQAVSKGAGVVLLGAAVLGVLWFAIG